MTLPLRVDRGRAVRPIDLRLRHESMQRALRLLIETVKVHHAG